MMKASELVAKCKQVATDFNTLYVMGCFGAPLTDKNKKRYTNNHKYNMQDARTAMINAASEDTFGFDCVCFIKGILWGWSGDASKTYGGAVYKSNDVPDTSADGMIRKCSDISTDFSAILPGEVVWMPGHIGVYIGEGLAVECTPKWANKVQITAVHNIGKKGGYNGRKWTKHGKLPFVDYSDANKTVAEVAAEINAALIASGYSPVEVAAEMVKQPEVPEPEAPVMKTIDEIAREVINGKWGNGTARKQMLVEAGYDYNAVQNRVNEILRGD